MTLNLLGDRIIVAPKGPATKARNGLVLPQKHRPAAQGMVVAVGSKVKFKGFLAPGDEVAFRPYAGTEIDIRGTMYRMFNSDELIGKIAKDAEIEADA